MRRTLLVVSLLVSACRGRDEKEATQPAPEVAAPAPSSAASTSTSPSSAPSAPAAKERTIDCSLATKLPPGGKVIVGGAEMPVENGKLSLRVREGAMVLVTVKSGERTFVQKIEAKAEGCVPDAIDATK